MADTNVAPSQLPDHTPLMVHTVRGVIGTCAVLALVVCCLRLYVRRCVIRAFGLDDYLVLLALVMVLAFAALSLILTRYAIGYHQNTVPAANMIIMAKYVYVLFCLYLWVALAVKCSLTIFIMRIFPTPKIRRIGLMIMALMTIVTVSGELPLILQCWPVRATWDKTLPDYKCFSDAVLENLQLYQAILMPLFDLMIIGLPMPTIWRLQMPIQRRLFIIGILCLGLVACAAGLARIPLLGFQENSTDYTYVGAVPLILMNLEYALGVITGSLPSLRVLVRFIPGLNSSKRSTYPTQEWDLSEQAECRLEGRPRWMHPLRGCDAKSIESESQQHILEVQKSPRPLETADCG
ncbi:hypothetical protein ASPACDRAFT_44789 [Aspergillus aculeatus ATCC 16872]|uniref:Rhodopsin domain-containing protein n=1 Tax=Aspergillus aculeatus (strain ATCC 16872 / CBS 172.66 / WB 5094) TaxID=690307 RepID=A0A1L9WQ31_ASPA1|nr:uncharacterized protein ASPACDRAFT_44789 [Aspergillus aculeatus ATCC 16872]OJJ98284.1 hypothetical protein ASPACDRAFT_44789 [Aspergillus aculeatus ATCC 16872]